MRRIICFWVSTFILFFAQAQGTLKGVVLDTKTKEALPFTNVKVFKDTVCVDSTSADLDGVFTFQNLPAGVYDITASSLGYKSRKSKSVEIEPTGFTIIDVRLEPIPIDYKRSDIIDDHTDSVDYLSEYKIVYPKLKLILDRIIEGKENTYFWSEKTYEPKPQPEGATLNLYLFSEPRIDTTSDKTPARCNYLYMLYRGYNYLYNIKLPLPIDTDAPPFSFDSTMAIIQATTTFYPQTFSDGTNGFVEYKGRIFFLCMSSDEIDNRYFRITKSKRSFKYKSVPVCIWDPATWLYTMQQGHWYRWQEFPHGY